MGTEHARAFAESNTLALQVLSLLAVLVQKCKYLHRIYSLPPTYHTCSLLVGLEAKACLTLESSCSGSTVMTLVA